MHTSKVVFKTSNRKILIINLQLLSSALRFIMTGNPSVDYTNQTQMVSLIANPSADYTNKKNGFLTRPLCHAEFYFLFFRQAKASVKCIWNTRDTVEEGTEVIFSAPSPIPCVILSMPASCLPE